MNNIVLGEEWKIFTSFWKIKSLPSTQFCAWMVMLNRLPTQDQLVRRVINVDNIVCSSLQRVLQMSNTCVLGECGTNVENGWVSVTS